METNLRAASSFTHRLFRLLLRLFPADFRKDFGREMEFVFHEQQRDASTGGTHARFLCETSAGMVSTAFRQHREILQRDIAYALRLMRKNPGFTFVALLILGLGIGASTAAFTAANAILIQPLPFTGGNRLIELHQQQPKAGIDDLGFSVPELVDYRTRSQTIDSLVEYHEMPFTLLGGREPLRVDAGVVSANFFRALGVAPLFGRAFLDDDERPSALPVLVLSYQFWQRAFGGDPSVVGQYFSMNDKRHLVIGVLPALPQFPEVVDVYMPTTACPSRSSARMIGNRDGRMMNAFATLKPGVTLEQATADLQTVAHRLQVAYPKSYPAEKGFALTVAAVHDELSHDIRPILIALTAATVLLLILACANVSGLILSRMMGRSHELAVRTALGASRGRIVRGFVTEGVVLALFGGLLGLALSFSSVGMLQKFAAKFTTLSSQLHFGPEVVAFAIVASILCGLALGLVQAVAVRHSAVFDLNLGNTMTPGRVSLRARGVLVACQLALSVMLLVGAGLTLRSLLLLENMDPGFEPRNLLTARFYVLNDRSKAFFDQLLERVRQLPGVTSAGLSSGVPLDTRGRGAPMPIQIKGDVNSSHRDPSAHFRIATADYFSTLKIPVLEGRAFTEHDTLKTEPVAVISRHMARRYWPAGNAVGQQIKQEMFSDSWLKVVGVVGDVRQYSLSQDFPDQVFLPLLQEQSNVLNLVTRASDLPSLQQKISQVAHEVDPDAAITDVLPMTQIKSNSLASPRMTAIGLGIFAIVALCITAAGVSGMMALSVSERKHEIGVRLALGATPRAVMAALLGQALLLIVGGLGSGLLIAWLMSTSMTKLIFGIPPRDVITFGVSALLLVLVATLSCCLPLTRVAKFDPMVALKAQ